MREGDGDSEPAHHARRPMNAFLIFCKRHRSVVRDKYPNLENRSITKILGEWWANLDDEDKESYTGLAKQYKDAFFTANPDFKWYKLPAPPLRTLASRPRESHEKPTQPPTLDYQTDVEKTNNNSTKVDLNNRPSNHLPIEEQEKSPSMFTPGKLADEAHMGGLSSLLETKTEPQTLNPYYSPPSYKYNPYINKTHNHDALSAKDDSIRELQNALSETTRVFENFDENKTCNDQFTNQDVINQIVDKRYSKDDEQELEHNQKNWTDYDQITKSGRSCKGKRYQEFMAVGGLYVNKRQKRDSDKNFDENLDASCSWEDSRADIDKPNLKSEESVDQFKTVKPDTSNAPDQDNNDNKSYKSTDFDLDAKIRALPSLSLEKFQEKKRENKRKKKMLSLKPKLERSSPTPIINSVPRTLSEERREVADKWRDQVIGSQKRKPRKVSITRLEINSHAPCVGFNETHTISPEIKIATEAPCTTTSYEMREPCHGAIDLFALATLAEVAANTSKIEESAAILSSMAAKSREEDASTV